MDKKFSELGFTLVETLAVIIVVSIAGSVIAAILFSSFRGSGKTESLSVVRLNGNQAILQMSKLIEFAQRFGGASVNGTEYANSCVADDPTQPPKKYRYIKIISFDKKETIFSCQVDETSYIASNSASLTDTSSVDVTNCYFTCNQKSVIDSPTIGINFTLESKNYEGQEDSSIDFSTSVTMRNVNR